MTNKSWIFLKPGDIVDIIAPSSSVPTDNLLEYYKSAEKILAKFDLIARIPSDLINLDKDLFSANSLEYRSKHLISALNDPNSKAIWAIRGGYGAAKIIPHLEKITPPTQPKLLLGFSDITALHLFLQNNWHWNSIHSPVINQIITNESLFTKLEPIIFGKEIKVIYNNLQPLNEAAEKNQEIIAEITGGNLSIVQTSLATSWQINGDNKIIFLEDIGEKGYQIDRMLNHLLQAGVFAKAKAIIFGEITPRFETDGRDLCFKAIENFASSLEIPALSLPIIGHNAKNNSPLPLGSTCILNINDNISLSCNSGGAFKEEYTC